MADDFDAWPQSELAPGRLLAALAQLLRSSRSVTDLSAERVGRALRIVPEVISDTAYRYSARLSPQWRFMLGYDGLFPSGPMLMFGLYDRSGRADAEMSEVSEFDLDGLTAGLEGGRFERRPMLAEHGLLSGYEFSRPGLTIRVSTRGESADRDRVGHDCITGIRVT